MNLNLVLLAWSISEIADLLGFLAISLAESLAAWLLHVSFTHFPALGVCLVTRWPPLATTILVANVACL